MNVKTAGDDALRTRLAERAQHAPDDLVRVLLGLLDQAFADTCWNAHIGPFLATRDVARLLGVSRQAVAKRADLLAIATGSGRLAYPTFQFAGRRVLPGLGDVIAQFDHFAETLTVASWLTSPNADLGQRSPVDALRDDDIGAVVAAAKRQAAAYAA
ncbi:MAG: DUF2384 domain-containing protein [Euzebyaceae bacterium]|nr:DUF2384 domain-containing protein [Euzebyaceae bacterium]